MPRRVVAVHQPNFFPWLGFFDKIVRADAFIILDHVQFSESGGNWGNRVRMDVNGRPDWVTMPVSRDYNGRRRIDETRIDNLQPWRRKLLQSLRMSYGRALGFRSEFEFVSELVQNPTDMLSDYNLSAILAICARLGLPTAHIVCSSTLDAHAAKTELLIELVGLVDGNVYLAGGGAVGYQDDQLFAAAGVTVEYQRFAHPVYPQRSGAPFEPGLSVLDAILHRGSEETAKLLSAAPAAKPGSTS